MAQVRSRQGRAEHSLARRFFRSVHERRILPGRTDVRPLACLPVTGIGNSSRVLRIPAARSTVAVLALASVLFAGLTVAVLASNEADRLDVRFVTWVHESSPDALVDAMRVLTYLGNVVVLGIVALIAGSVLARRGYWRATVFLFTAFLAGQLVSQGLKHSIERRRPELDEPFALLTTYAFPSGHAFGATTTWGALAIVTWSLTSNRGRRVRAAAGATLIVIVVAASRVVLGVHFTLDVLAGVAGGIAVLAGLLLALGPLSVTGRVRLRRNQQPQRGALDGQLERRLEQDGLAVDRGSRDALS
jgi:undecaprenyl-diphosphatase